MRLTSSKSLPIFLSEDLDGAIFEGASLLLHIPNFLYAGRIPLSLDLLHFESPQVAECSLECIPRLDVYLLSIYQVIRASVVFLSSSLLSRNLHL